MESCWSLYWFELELNKTRGFHFQFPCIMLIPGVHLETECQVKLYVSTETEARFSGFWCCVIKASADYCCPHNLGIEHSENQTVTYFEKEVGPVVLQSSVQQTYNLSTRTDNAKSSDLFCDKSRR